MSENEIKLLFITSFVDAVQLIFTVIGVITVIVYLTFPNLHLTLT